MNCCLRRGSLRRLAASLHHLAARFVPVEQRGHHVVDPSLDWSHLFQSPAQLSAALRLRGQSENVENLKENYNNWLTAWKRYRELERNDKSSDDGKKSPELIAARRELISNWSGLVNVLELPNLELDENDDSSGEAPTTAASSGSQCCRSAKSFSLHVRKMEEKRLLRVDGPGESLHLNGRLATILDEVVARARRSLSTDSTIYVSPPYRIRPALIEASGLPLGDYFQVSEKGSELSEATALYLVGVQVSAILALLTRTRLPTSGTTFPVSLLADGMGYFRKTSRTVALWNAVEREQICHLSLTGALPESERAAAERVVGFLDDLVSQRLSLPVHRRRVPANQLKAFERGAVSWTYRDGDDDVQVARVSLCGDYLSRRINLTAGQDNKEWAFARMVLATVDARAIVGVLADTSLGGKHVIPPKLDPFGKEGGQLGDDSPLEQLAII